MANLLFQMRYKKNKINNKHTVTRNLGEGDIKVNGHLGLSAAIDNKRGLDVDRPVVKELAQKQDCNDNGTHKCN